LNLNFKQSMTRYSINDLEKITGIKAHTIRMWEKRYQVTNPERTDTNIRYYFDSDLKKLLNISTLNRHGIKISHIVKMPEQDIREKILQINNNNSDYESQINSLVVAMIEMQEEVFEKILSNNILKIGFEKTVTRILYPFLEKIGVLWQIGTINPAQEHFMVGLIRAKIIVAIEGQEQLKNEKSKTFILFLPEGEMHELGLLFCHYLLKRRGHKVIYLGQSLPYKDLLSVAKIKENARYLLTYFVSAFKSEELAPYLKRISADLPDRKLLATGIQLNGMETDLPNNIIPFQNTDALLKIIDNF
jgi:MerR family transcriptional regulator, light-induced transcriptional regulator